MSRRSLAHQSSGTFPQRSESSHWPASVIYRELGNSWALRRQGSLRWKSTFMREEAEERAAKGEGWRLDGLTEHRGSARLERVGPKVKRPINKSSAWASVAMKGFSPVQKHDSCWSSCLRLLVFPFYHFHTSLPVFSWFNAIKTLFQRSHAALYS